MPIDVTTPDSPGWWLLRLQRKLDVRRKRIDPLYARYEGSAEMPVELSAAPETARRFYRAARTNFAEMLVKAVRYRLRVAYIATANEAGDQGDAEAWRAWRRAGMVVEASDIERHMLIAGDGYAMVGMHERQVAATSEDPRQVVTIHDPVRQSVVRAAAKFFRDVDEETDYAYLHRPGRVWCARRTRPGTSATPVRFSAAWEWDEQRGGQDGAALPDVGYLGVVRYRNDEGVGEFERHLDLLHRIDHLILQGMVIATLQAFKQRAIKVDPRDMPDVDPETGEDIDYNDVLSADPGALWKLPVAAEMWESGAVDVTPIVGMIQKEIERLSAVTFTPMSAFSPEGANQSAQGASLIKEGAVLKTEDKQRRAGAAHAQTAALIFQLAGLDVGSPEDIVIGWAPAERHGLSERGEAAQAAKESGVPWATIMRDIWGFSPEQVERMKAERFSDTLLFAGVAGDAPAQ